MKQIRIHNDIQFSWTIDRGDGTPYNLAGKDLRLWMHVGTQEIEFTDFVILDNKIMWTFYGRDQYKLGMYDVVLCENAGQVGEITIDETDIVELVAHTQSANGEDGNDYISAQYVDVVSRLKSELYSGLAQEIYDNYVLNIQVLVKNGANMLRAGYSADLEAVVTLGDRDISSIIPSSLYSWRRSSASPEGDIAWNLQHEGVGREIHVERGDVATSCTFYCVLQKESIINYLSLT